MKSLVSSRKKGMRNVMSRTEIIFVKDQSTVGSHRVVFPSPERNGMGKKLPFPHGAGFGEGQLEGISGWILL